MSAARILYAIPNFVTAGSGQAMVNVIDRLDRSKFEPAVCVRSLGGHLVDHLRERDVEVFQAEFTVPPRPYATLARRVAVAARPFRGRFDLWHSFNYADDYTEALIAYRSGARSWVYTKKNMSWGSRGWLVRSYLSRRIATQNTEMATRFFRRPGLRHKVRYVPPGIDVERWETASPLPNLREDLGIAPTDVVIACVGNVMPGKNQLAIARAMGHAPDAHLVVAGRLLDQEYATQVEDAGPRGRVHLLGPVDDVAGLLRCCDLFAFTSYREGSPVVMLEAMAAGLPGVYSAIPGITERVRPGTDAFLVGPDDTSTLATHLGALISSPDLRHRMGAAATASVRTHGRVECEVARYETLYLECL